MNDKDKLKLYPLKDVLNIKYLLDKADDFCIEMIEKGLADNILNK